MLFSENVHQRNGNFYMLYLFRTIIIFLILVLYSREGWVGIFIRGILLRDIEHVSGF